MFFELFNYEWVCQRNGILKNLNLNNKNGIPPEQLRCFRIFEQLTSFVARSDVPLAGIAANQLIEPVRAETVHVLGVKVDFCQLAKLPKLYKLTRDSSSWANSQTKYHKFLSRMLVVEADIL